VQNAFNAALTEFSGTDPTKRHVILKQQSSTKLWQIFNIKNTQILPKHLEQCKTFIELHTALYCAAIATVWSNGCKTKPQYVKNDYQHQQKAPPWRRRLQTRVENIRKGLGRLTQYINDARTKRLTKRVRKILRDKEIHSKYESDNTKLKEYKDTLEQKLSALVKRLRTYKKAMTESGKINNLWTMKNYFIDPLQNLITQTQITDHLQQTHYMITGLTYGLIRLNSMTTHYGSEKRKTSSAIQMTCPIQK